MALDPQSDRAWFQKGRAYEREGQLDEAVDALKRAISYNTRASSYYYVLASVYRRQNRMDESREALETFKRLDRETSELDKKRRGAADPQPARGRKRIVSSGTVRGPSRRLFLRALGGCVGSVSAPGWRAAFRRSLDEPDRVVFTDVTAAAGLLARRERLGQPGQQALPARGDGLRRGALRLRQRRLAGHLPRQRQQLRPRRPRSAARQLPLSQQPRRHVHRRHREGRVDPLGLGAGLLRRRLRQRRLRRSLRDLLGAQRPLSQQRRRHVHRRVRKGRRCRVGKRLGRRLRLSRLRPRRPSRFLRRQLRELRSRQKRRSRASRRTAATTRSRSRAGRWALPAAPTSSTAIAATARSPTSPKPLASPGPEVRPRWCSSTTTGGRPAPTGWARPSRTSTTTAGRTSTSPATARRACSIATTTTGRSARLRCRPAARSTRTASPSPAWAWALAISTPTAVSTSSAPTSPSR